VLPLLLMGAVWLRLSLDQYEFRVPFIICFT
jgi:hypothetical protein